jgi:hypothetical protein
LKTGGYFMLSACNARKPRHGYPDDYWRFTPESYQAVFKDQKIIDQESKNFNEMIMVQKQTEFLNLEVNVLTVDEATLHKTKKHARK